MYTHCTAYCALPLDDHREENSSFDQENASFDPFGMDAAGIDSFADFSGYVAATGAAVAGKYMCMYV